MGNIPTLEGSDRPEKDEEYDPKPSNEVKSLTIGAGVTVTFDKKGHSRNFPECHIDVGDNALRNAHFRDVVTSQDMTMVSDVFCVKEGTVTHAHEFTVGVPLQKVITPYQEVVVRFKDDKAKWTTSKAVHTKNFAEFRTSRLSMFIVVSEPKKKKVAVSSEGITITDDVDSKMCVQIPKGALKKAQNVTFSCHAPEESARAKYQQSIASLSPLIYVDHDPDFHLEKPALLSLPLDKPQNEADSRLVVFRWQGSQPEVMEDCDATWDQDGVCRISVRGFSGYCAVWTSSLSPSSMTSVSSLLTEARLIYGHCDLCKLMIFLVTPSQPASRFLTFRVEMVEAGRAEEVAKRQKAYNMTELPHSESRDFEVKDGFRLRVAIAGAVRGLPEVPKSYYLLTYLRVAKNNHLTFTVDRPTAYTSVPYGVFNFLSDSGSKRCLHSVQFDTQARFWETREERARPELRRADSNLSLKSAFLSLH